MRPKLTFIGRSYHAKTKSDQLILSVLEKSFEVTVLRREKFRNKEIASVIEKERPFAVLFWCLPPSFTFHLLKLKCRNIFWAPMWDGFEPLSFKKRLIFALYNIKIICFSQKLRDYFKKTALKSGYWQCFLPLQKSTDYKKTGPYTFFFWQRDRSIDLKGLIKMLGKDKIKKIIYKSEIGSPKKNHFPVEIEELPDWIEKSLYLKKINEADFFVAPRKAEGIGFSFLEPMSLKKPVIAYDDSTMNEYVVDGVNGHLFGDDFKLKSPLKSPYELSKGIEELNGGFYQNWSQSLNEINKFILQSGKVGK